MKSPLTGKPMPIVRQKASVAFRKETFAIYQHYYFCQQSGGQFSTGLLENINQVQLYNKYRQKHNIPTSDEMAMIRESYGLSLVKMAEVLGLGVNVYRHYEMGEVPSLSNARLIQLCKNPDNMISLMQANGVLKERERKKLMARIQELKKLHSGSQYLAGKNLLTGWPVGEYSGFVVPRQEVVLQLIQQIAARGPLKLNQVPVVLFLADFSHYRQHGKGISGLYYYQENHSLSVFNLLGILHWAASTGVCSITFDQQGRGVLLPAKSSSGENGPAREINQPAFLQAIDKLTDRLQQHFPEELTSRIPSSLQGALQGAPLFISYDAAFEMDELDDWAFFS